MKKAKFLFFALVIFLLCSNLFSLDSLSLLEKVSSNFQRIKSIRAQVDQIVVLRNREFRYSGFYIAKTPGIVKVVYTYPTKYILWIDRKGTLYWYLPDSKLLYYAEHTTGRGNSSNGLIPLIPGKNNLREKKKFYTVGPLRVKGFWSFKKYIIDLIPKKEYPNLPLIRMYIYPGYPVARRVELIRGNKIVMVQEMDAIKKVGGIFFPYIIRFESEPNHLKTETHYISVELNVPFSEKDFHVDLPPDVTKVRLTDLLGK